MWNHIMRIVHPYYYSHIQYYLSQIYYYSDHNMLFTSYFFPKMNILLNCNFVLFLFLMNIILLHLRKYIILQFFDCFTYQKNWITSSRRKSHLFYIQIYFFLNLLHLIFQFLSYQYIFLQYYQYVKSRYFLKLYAHLQIRFINYKHC